MGLGGCGEESGFAMTISRSSMSKQLVGGKAKGKKNQVPPLRGPVSAGPGKAKNPRRNTKR